MWHGWETFQNHKWEENRKKTQVNKREDKIIKTHQIGSLSFWLAIFSTIKTIKIKKQYKQQATSLLGLTGLCAIIERRRKKDEAEQDDPSAGCHEKSLTIINTLKTLRQMCSGWRWGWGEMFQSFPSVANLGQCVKIRLHAEVRSNTSQAQFCCTSSTWHESMCLSLLTWGSIRTYATAATDSLWWGRFRVCGVELNA